MAWMPVAEAAASLGVSERTIWRRIKSETISSRSDQGRTLVALEDLDPDADPVRQLSHVAAAQLSMRKLDADTVSDVLAVVADYRSSFDAEIARSRRSLRLTGFVAVVLLFALCGGAWFHMDKLYGLQRDHDKAMGDAQQEHLNAVAAIREEAARAEGLAGARAGEIETLRTTEADHRARLEDVETSRKLLQASADKQVTGLHQVLSDQQRNASRRDWEIARLTTTVEKLRTELAHKTQVYKAVRRQLEKAGEAIRRSAARNAGTAEGLRLYVQNQHTQLVRLRSDLATARLALGNTGDDLPQAETTVSREAIRQAIVGERSSSVHLAEPIWRSTLRSLLSLWPASPTQPSEHADLAQAG